MLQTFIRDALKKIEKVDEKLAFLQDQLVMENAAMAHQRVEEMEAKLRVAKFHSSEVGQMVSTLQCELDMVHHRIKELERRIACAIDGKCFILGMEREVIELFDA